MGIPSFEVVVIGGGQAGLAMSYCLTAQGRPHVVLEQERIAESWRSRRWDSLRVIGPNWTLQMPGFPYAGDDPDGFMSKAELVAYFEAYANAFGAPVREGVRVLAVDQDPESAGFLLRTNGGTYAADQVVVATGALQRPSLPSCAADLPASVAQVVPTAYRNPAALSPGAVLVVGSGETGCQIAEELRRAGRPVYLSVGRSWWAPRRYRGREIVAWLEEMGIFDQTVDSLPPGARTGGPSPQLTGSDGGRDLNVHTLVGEGVRLLGRLEGVRDGVASFAPDLIANLEAGGTQAAGLLKAIDDHILQRGLTAPEEGLPGYLRPAAELAQAAPTKLDLEGAGIGTVIWATGYRPDLDWIRLPILDSDGYPRQRRGVTAAPGLYILGLDWLYKAKSGLFHGVGADAVYLASIIAAQATAPSTPA